MVDVALCRMFDDGGQSMRRIVVPVQLYGLFAPVAHSAIVGHARNVTGRVL